MSFAVGMIVAAYVLANVAILAVVHVGTRHDRD